MTKQTSSLDNFVSQDIQLAFLGETGLNETSDNTDLFVAKVMVLQGGISKRRSMEE